MTASSEAFQIKWPLGIVPVLGSLTTAGGLVIDGKWIRDRGLSLCRSGHETEALWPWDLERVGTDFVGEQIAGALLVSSEVVTFTNG